MNVWVNNYLLEWSRDLFCTDRWQKMTLWSLVIMTRCLLAGFRYFTLLRIGTNVSNKIHANMFYQVIHSKVHEFLDKIPIGRIMNRFTKDIDILDTQLFGTISYGYVVSTTVLADLYVVADKTSLLMVIIVLLFMAIGIYLQRCYIKTKRELTRLEVISNSPILGVFSEIIKNLAEVRAMKLQKYILEKLDYLIDENLKNSVLLFGSDRWFQTRICLANYLLVQVSCYSILIYQLHDTIDSVRIAMTIIYATNITFDAIDSLQMISQMETQFIAVERCANFEKIEPEEGYQNFSAQRKKMTRLPIKANKLNCSDYAPKLNITNYQIVKKGLIEFKHVYARYPNKDIDVMKDLDFVVQPGEKIGVIGKTAAGKTSLIKLFWRCLEVYKGEISIDGKDISKCDLKILRSEMDIVSQSVSIFAGTLRENLNPQDANNKNDDQILLDILQKLEFNNGSEIDLDMLIDSDGSNLSTGEAQIISFARI